MLCVFFSHFAHKKEEAVSPHAKFHAAIKSLLFFSSSSFLLLYIPFQTVSIFNLFALFSMFSLCCFGVHLPQPVSLCALSWFRSHVKKKRRKSKKTKTAREWKHRRMHTHTFIQARTQDPSQPNRSYRTESLSMANDTLAPMWFPIQLNL